MHQVLGDDVKVIAVLRHPVERSYSHYKMETQRNVHMAESYDKLVNAEVEALRKAGLTSAMPLQEFNAAAAVAFQNNNNNNTHEETQRYTFQLHRIPRDFSARRRIVAQSATPRQYKEKPMKDSSLYTGMYATQLDEWMQYYPLNKSLLVVRSEELSSNASAVLARVQAFLGVPMEEFHNDVTDSNYNPLKGGRGWREGAAMQVDRPSNETLLYLRRFYEPHNQELADLLGEDWRNVWD
jgi:hypothetical protein